MAFSQFTLKSAKAELGLSLLENQRLFPAVQPAPISDYLRTTLDRFSPLALAIGSEKARSEWIIAPILAELREQAGRKISLFSGTNWSVDPDRGLEGYFDYIISLSPEQFYLTAPVLIIVEAKKEDIIAGLGQCLATMYAAALFNQREGNEIDSVYGAVTSGQVWRFLKLTGNQAWIDLDEYYLKETEKLLGILVSLATPQGQSSALAMAEKI